MITAVRWWHRLRGPALGWIAALLVALLAAAGSGEAVTLNPGDILVTDSGGAAIIRLNPIDGKPTVVAQGAISPFPAASRSRPTVTYSWSTDSAVTAARVG